MYFNCQYLSPLGSIDLLFAEDALVGLWLGEKRFMQEAIQGLVMSEANSQCLILKETKNWLDAYFAGHNPSLNHLTLKPLHATAFRYMVWQHLLEIPYGEVETYGHIAKQIAKDRGQANMSAQAVGGAVGHNPISLIIPCHRVLAQNGALTGYGGGIKNKAWLLNHEKLTLH
ncbi:methylated-DNA--[protein]-cysteine S-methyltransferase [Facklamia sp. DSM 111018]|uniref:Methylated-DNA--[protein]-cysteine S-methyltransferase n=1 Tax=Facklamia lactis TaxID=2749967 RepID=A0ABS0LS24_9LACT|nr:methylated-DNA--[protein]-cysteine S-methyltransferase [Facklamia lactis]MBG9986131.1 methylated-DNA--[protein]-cysteine S-methyltransferase [Facklamia lactis]